MTGIQYVPFPDYISSPASFHVKKKPASPRADDIPCNFISRPISRVAHGMMHNLDVRLQLCSTHFHYQTKAIDKNGGEHTTPGNPTHMDACD